MSTSMPIPGGIVHLELPSADFARSAAFYGKLFGWKTDGVQSGGHLLFELPGGVQGSWIRDALAQAPGPVPFVAVPDVDKALGEAVRLGGRILVRRLTLANRGMFGLLADCDGNVIGVLAERAERATAGTAPAAGPAAAKPKIKDAPASKTAPAAQQVDGKSAPKAVAKSKPAAKPVVAKSSDRKR